MTDTDIAVNSARLRGGPAVVNDALAMLAKYGNKLVARSVRAGAQPQLYAATSPDVRGGECYGPAGPLELFGPPGRIHPRRFARDRETAAELWRHTAEMTGVTPDPD